MMNIIEGYKSTNLATYQAAANDCVSEGAWYLARLSLARTVHEKPHTKSPPPAPSSASPFTTSTKAAGKDENKIIVGIHGQMVCKSCS